VCIACRLQYLLVHCAVTPTESCTTSSEFHCGRQQMRRATWPIVQNVPVTVREDRAHSSCTAYSPTNCGPCCGHLAGVHSGRLDGSTGTLYVLPNCRCVPHTAQRHESLVRHRSGVVLGPTFCVIFLSPRIHFSADSRT